MTLNIKTARRNKFYLKDLTPVISRQDQETQHLRFYLRIYFVEEGTKPAQSHPFDVGLFEWF